MPCEPVFGPRPALPDWLPAASAVCRARRAASEGDRQGTQTCLDEAYCKWARAAEEEIADVTGIIRRRNGQRGKAPKLELRPVLRSQPQAACGLPDARLPFQLKWLLSRVSDLTSTATRIDACTDLIHPPSWMDAAEPRVKHFHLHARVQAIAATRCEHAPQEQTQRLQRALVQACAHAAEVHSKLAKQRYQEWLDEATDGKASLAYKHMQEPHQWTPTIVEQSDGVLTSDPRKVLAAAREQWAAEWQAESLEPAPQEVQWWAELEEAAEATPARPRLSPQVAERRQLVHAEHRRVL